MDKRTSGRDGLWAPRPTIYKGIQMRSRLEAGFAQQLEADGIPDWVYEPAAYADETGQYLPDFQLGHDVDAFVEVKPASVSWSAFLAAFARMHIIRSSHPKADLLLEVGRWNRDRYEFRNAAWCTLPEGVTRQDICPICSERPAEEVMADVVELMSTGVDILRALEIIEQQDFARWADYEPSITTEEF